MFNIILFWYSMEHQIKVITDQTVGSFVLKELETWPQSSYFHPYL